MHGPLRGESKQPHRLAQLRQTQRHLELLLDEFADQRTSSQTKLKLQLVGCVVSYRIGHPLQLLGIELRRATYIGLCCQRSLTSSGKVCHPLEYSASCHAENSATYFEQYPSRISLTPCIRIHYYSIRRECRECNMGLLGRLLLMQ
jgi:hypothetical protein